MTRGGGHPRSFTACEPGVSARIKRNPARTENYPIDQALYKERRLAECFRNRIERIRRIALRWGKTITSFKAFLRLARAMTWIT